MAQHLMEIHLITDTLPELPHRLPGPVVVLTGPTASGKSSVALLLALRVGGEIVCADSMQIYQDMDIGTAKPSEADTRLVRHHLFDIVSPEDTFSVASYSAAATSAIREILGRGKVPIVCGGTGQYISALIEGIEFTSMSIDYGLRARLEAEAEEFGIQHLLERLKQIDPSAAAPLHPNDTKRIIRALEVFEQTGMTKTQLNQKSLEKGPDFDFLGFCMNVERTRLYQRIDSRVDKMVQDGLSDELRRLRAKYPIRSKTALQAIGYKEMEAYLDGCISLEESIAAIKQASRNYAKRQLTWFRRIPSLVWIDNTDPVMTADAITDRLMLHQIVSDGENIQPD